MEYRSKIELYSILCKKSFIGYSINIPELGSTY
jgi:hypothetical protein